MKIKHILVAVLAALLCTCLLAGTTLTALASDTIDLNFGILGAENNDTLLPSDLFEVLYPSLMLSDAEGDYLDGKLLPLIYNDSIPQDTVRTHYARWHGRWPRADAGRRRGPSACGRGTG